MKQVQMSIPHLFRCPISLDLIKDPVTLCTGQTYDRSSIEKWLAAGNLTCPVTMQKLHDPTMVPNHTLGHLINQWLQMGHQLDPDYLETIDSLASLKHTLESHEANPETKIQALEKIRVLSQESPSRNDMLLQLGFLPLLLELVFGQGEAKLLADQDLYIKFVEPALCCILILLPLDKLGSLNVLKQESKLASFQVLFAHGTVFIRMSLCRLIEATSLSLSSSSSPSSSRLDRSKGLCSMLGKNHRLVHQMVELLHQNSEAADAGIKAISALTSLEENREVLVRQGIVNGLIAYISSSERRERSLAALAMATLEKLLDTESAKEGLVSNRNGIHALVKMVFRVSSDHQGSESAVGSLIIVCNDSLLAQEEAISGGVLSQLLLLLQCQCSGRTKTKARMLLKLLRTKCSHDPTMPSL